MGIASILREKMDPGYKERRVLEAIEKYQGSKTTTKKTSSLTGKVKTYASTTNPTASIRAIPTNVSKETIRRSNMTFIDTIGGEEMANIYNGGKVRSTGSSILGETVKAAAGIVPPMIGAKSGKIYEKKVGRSAFDAANGTLSSLGNKYYNTQSTVQSGDNPYFSVDSSGNFVAKKEEVKRINLSQNERMMSSEEEWALGLLREAGDEEFNKGVNDFERNKFRSLASCLEKRDIEGIRNVFAWFAEAFGDYRKKLPSSAIYMFAVIGKFAKSIGVQLQMNTGVSQEVITKIETFNAMYNGVISTESNIQAIPDTVSNALEDMFNRYKELDNTSLYSTVAKVYNILNAIKQNPFAISMVGSIKVQVQDILEAIKRTTQQINQTQNGRKMRFSRGGNLNINNTNTVQGGSIGLPNDTGFIETDLNKALANNRTTTGTAGSGWKSLSDSLKNGISNGTIGSGRRTMINDNDDFSFNKNRSNDDYDDYGSPSGRFDDIGYNDRDNRDYDSDKIVPVLRKVRGRNYGETENINRNSVSRR